MDTSNVRENLRDIREDLRDSLQYIDKNNYVYNSIMSHLETECDEVEVQIIKDMIYELDVTEYNGREGFIEDYQPIFDTVDFPLAECFRVMDKRTLNYDAL